MDSHGIDDAISDLVTAYERVAERIDTAFTTEDDVALEKIREVYDQLGKLRERSAALRADLVGRLWEREQLSLTKLADRIGVSRQRADQLLKQRDRDERTA